MDHSDDFFERRERECLPYSGEIDEELTAMNVEQTERLAKRLVKVILDGGLSKELTLNTKFPILFRYVQFLRF